MTAPRVDQGGVVKNAFSASVAVVSILSLAIPARAADLTPYLSGLSSPLYLTHPPDGSGRLFVVEGTGAIKVLQPGATTPTIFLDISTRILAGGERGLLGLAFHPLYASNGRLFVYYTRAGDGAVVLAEYRVSGTNPNQADAASERILLWFDHPLSNHNGGMLAFNPNDGFLYIGVGDGGGANDPNKYAQNINTVLGKILRIDVDPSDQTVAYGSPVSNPFYGSIPGLDEIYAYGVRNPWRFSFDRLTYSLYLADVGQGAREEVDVVTNGGNYGWRVFEGSACTNLDPALCQSPGNYVFPIAEYDHSVNGRCSIIGGYVYRGNQGTFPQGAYIYGDYCSGEIFMHSGGSQTTLMDTPLNISSFGEDADGEIYVVGLGGTVHKLTPSTQSCNYSVSPTSASFPSTGGSSTVSVTTGAGCQWTATSPTKWITITSGGATGSGSATYTVARNQARKARQGAIVVAGITITINQAGR